MATYFIGAAPQNSSSHSTLHESLRLVRSPQRPRGGFFFRAECLFNLATEIERLAVERRRRRPNSSLPFIGRFDLLPRHRRDGAGSACRRPQNSTNEVARKRAH
jgi:hypothetical protein